jgi:hypothetical protein
MVKSEFGFRPKRGKERESNKTNKALAYKIKNLKEINTKIE